MSAAPEEPLTSANATLQPPENSTSPSGTEQDPIVLTRADAVLVAAVRELLPLHETTMLARSARWVTAVADACAAMDSGYSMNTVTSRLRFHALFSWFLDQRMRGIREWPSSPGIWSDMEAIFLAVATKDRGQSRVKVADVVSETPPASPSQGANVAVDIQPAAMTTLVGAVSTVQAMALAASDAMAEEATLHTTAVNGGASLTRSHRTVPVEPSPAVVACSRPASRAKSTSSSRVTRRRVRKSSKRAVPAALVAPISVPRSDNTVPNTFATADVISHVDVSPAKEPPCASSINVAIIDERPVTSVSDTTSPKITNQHPLVSEPSYSMSRETLSSSDPRIETSIEPCDAASFECGLSPHGTSGGVSDSSASSVCGADVVPAKRPKRSISSFPLASPTHDESLQLLHVLDCFLAIREAQAEDAREDRALKRQCLELERQKWEDRLQKLKCVALEEGRGTGDRYTPPDTQSNKSATRTV
jgi:hypothetical protein